MKLKCVGTETSSNTVYKLILKRFVEEKLIKIITKINCIFRFYLLNVYSIKPKDNSNEYTID